MTGYDEEDRANFTARARALRKALDAIEKSQTGVMAELRSTVRQALDVGAEWDLMGEISGLDLTEFAIEKHKDDGLVGDSPLRPTGSPRSG